MKKSYLLPFAALAFVITACADEVTQPEALLTPRSSAVSVDATRYIVGFNGNSQSVSGKVAALGGSVEFTHDRAGLLIASGLTSEAAASLASLDGVSDVIQDAEVQGAVRGT